MPTILLFEPRGLSLFQVVQGWDTVYLGLRHGPLSIAGRDPHPRPYTVPSNTNNEQSNSFCCRLISRNGYVVQFSFVESNATPFFQTINAMAAILRASVSRAISARMPFCFNLSRNGLYGSCKLPPVAAEMNTSFQTPVTVVVQASSGDGLSSSHHTAGGHFVFRTHMSDDCQANIAPELTLGSKPMRRVHRGNNESTAYGSHLRNRS